MLSPPVEEELALNIVNQIAVVVVEDKQAKTIILNEVIQILIQIGQLSRALEMAELIENRKVYVTAMRKLVSALVLIRKPGGTLHPHLISFRNKRPGEFVLLCESV
jgi:hypothetical protein